MGNLLCCAAPSEGHANVYGRLVTDETQTFNTCNGLLVKASTASWAANHPCEDRHLVHFLNDSSVLIGVFDGMGGPEAAQLCKVGRHQPLYRGKSIPICLVEFTATLHSAGKCSFSF